MASTTLMTTLATGLFGASLVCLVEGCGGNSSQGSGSGSDAGTQQDSAVAHAESGAASDAHAAHEGGHSGGDGGTAESGSHVDAAADAPAPPDAAEDVHAPVDAASDGHASAETGPPPDAAGTRDGEVRDSGSSSTNDAGDDAQANPDPFDPAVCTGAAMTVAEAASRFASGATTAVLAPYTLYLRQRSCNAVTGCTAWSAASFYYATLDQFSNPETLMAPASQDSGNLQLVVSGSTVTLSLDSTGPFGTFTAATCGTVTAPVTCAEYEIQYSYTELLQGGGTAQEPAEEPVLIGVQPLGETFAGGVNVPLTGTVTNHCALLSFTDPTGQYQAALYSTY